ncbi:MAG: hypothetical protein ORN98_06810 [Alphaproteobacteria bacterium]|nr:hypothetical protein [Alphaproteobacteria bacterium]
MRISRFPHSFRSSLGKAGLPVTPRKNHAAAGNDKEKIAAETEEVKLTRFNPPKPRKQTQKNPPKHHLAGGIEGGKSP